MHVLCACALSVDEFLCAPLSLGLCDERGSPLIICFGEHAVVVRKCSHLCTIFAGALWPSLLWSPAVTYGMSSWVGDGLRGVESHGLEVVMTCCAHVLV